MTAFSSAGIPLHTLENSNVRGWISKYVPGLRLPPLKEDLKVDLFVAELQWGAAVV